MLEQLRHTLSYKNSYGGSTPPMSTKFNNMNTDIVKKEHFKRYVDVQMSGVTNMFDVKTVSSLADLAVDQIIDIMKNYEKYKDKWPSVQQKQHRQIYRYII